MVCAVLAFGMIFTNKWNNLQFLHGTATYVLNMLQLHFFTEKHSHWQSMSEKEGVIVFWTHSEMQTLCVQNITPSFRVLRLHCCV